LGTTLLAAFGLMLIVEGVMPFLAPRAWRQTFQRMTELRDGQLRFIGLISMLGGLLFLIMAR
jgi:uncharacterized protein YjeT (DUF2065 family)